MNLKLVVVSALALGSSSLALADNVTVTAQPVVTAPMPAQAQAPMMWHGPARVWTVLSAADKISPNGRDTIRLGATRPLQRIKLEATGGRTTVTEIAIKFANGRTQIAYENVQLSRDHSLTIDIAGRAKDVASIRVFGASSPRGSFQILGA